MWHIGCENVNLIDEGGHSGSGSIRFPLPYLCFMNLSFKKTDSADQDFKNLVALLDADLRIRDGDDHGFYNQFNGIENIKDIVVCYKDGQPVACGAFKVFNDRTAEVKRMYVIPSERGAGIALLVLRELEACAKAKGFTECILETGVKQPEAIRLYEKAGYKRIENYGQYAGVKNSVCMARKLV
jgi:putative acetyltransferase